MSKLRIGNIEINYEIRGTAPKHVLFVHGLGENLESWKHQLEYFSKDFTAVALDLRGHGESSIPEKRIEVTDFVEDMKSLTDHLRIRRAHFCGLSMGALIILEMYKSHPNYFLSMSLVGSRPRYPPAQTAALESMTMQVIGEEVASFALASNASRTLREEVARMVSKTNKTVYIQSAEATSAIDCTSLLPSIKVPTLIVVGEQDIVAPVEYAKLLNKLISGSILRIMPVVGHLPNQENPEEFNTVLGNFLERI